jgi:putative ABC transport system ATP-binding protein
MQPIIKVEKLNVIYFLGKSNEVRALSDINLEIFPGEFIVFFGPSGCGKSTLLYSIAGLERNIEGNIFIDNKNLAEFSQKELETFHQTKIGMIFQAFYLISSLNVFDNVVLPQIFIRKNRKEREAKANELLDHFGVKSQADKLPMKLSGGQQQRVAICRSLMNDPDILLADEPLGNLDSTSAQEVMHLLKDLNSRHKKTVILVTHNPAYLIYAHRIFYMKDGRVIETKVNESIDETVISSKELSKQSISKDLELLARTYSSLSSSETGGLLIPFKAKQIVSEALLEMSSDDISKIEKKVERLLMFGLGIEGDLLRFLDDNIEKGGLGLDRRTAVKLAEKIKNIVKEIKVLEQNEEKLKKKEIIDIKEEILEIRHYLLEAFDVNIENTLALERISRLIKDRLVNKIDRVAFGKNLDLPIKKGGVGLDKRTAQKVSRRLELLILGKYK